MPKVKFEFDLPEETNDLKLAQRGKDYFCVIFEALQEIRTCLKHGHNFKTPEEALEEIRNILLEAQIEDIE